MTPQGTLLLGGAVILSAIGIIGAADIKLLENKPKCCHELNKSLEMLANDSEHCCEKIELLEEAIRQLCDLVSFEIRKIVFILRVFRWPF